MNFNEYFSYIKQVTINILPTQIVSVYATMKIPLVSHLLNSLMFPITFFSGLVLTMIQLVYSVFNWIRKKSIPWVSLGLSGMLVGYFVIGIYGAPIEVARHSICVIPLLIISICILLSESIEWIKNTGMNKIRNINS